MESAEAYALASLRFVLVLVFLLAGAGKVFDRKSFEKAVRNYKLVPERWARPIATWLPPAELAAAVLLLGNVATAAVAAAVAALLVTFAGAVAINLLRGREIDCGCFSTPAPKRITWLKVARNVVLAAAATALAIRTSTAGAGELAAGAAVATFVVSLQVVAGARIASVAAGYYRSARFFQVTPQSARGSR